MKNRASLFFLIGALVLAVCLVVGISLGSTHVSSSIVVRVIASHILPLNFINMADVPSADQTIIWLIRTPRVLVAACVGAALAVAGAQMQGLFQNPLASPDIIGTSSGGALGAVIAIATGLTTRSIFYLPLFAFIGAALAAFAVYGIATTRGKTPVATLLLAGMALNALIGAATSFVITVHWVRWEVSSEIIIWLLGGLESRTWEHVGLMAPCLVIGLAVAAIYARDLNVLLLNEESAASLGVEVQQVKRVVLLGTALLTGAAVAVSGLVGFVGLVIPHVVRLLLGPDHRVMIPACALMGAGFLILTDLFARTVTQPTEVRLGIVTAAVGAPFFLYLLVKQRKEIGYF